MIEPIWNMPRKALGRSFPMRRLPAIGSRCGAHVGLSTVAAEGTSLHSNRHISTTTANQSEKSAESDMDSYVAQVSYSYGIRIIPYSALPRIGCGRHKEKKKKKERKKKGPIPVYQRDKKGCGGVLVRTWIRRLTSIWWREHELREVMGYRWTRFRICFRCSSGVVVKAWYFRLFRGFESHRIRFFVFFPRILATLFTWITVSYTHLTLPTICSV